MVLLVLSYLAGMLTIVSPCILPVLPFVFARADQPFLRSIGSERRAARELARSGTFYGWRPIEFVLLFEDGVSEAREWLRMTATQEELDRLCRAARARRLEAA